MKHKIFLSMSFFIFQACWGASVPTKSDSTESINEFIPIVVLSEFIGAPKYSDVAPTIYINTDDTNWIRKEIQGSSGRIRSISCISQYCAGVGDTYSTTNGKITTALTTYNSYDGGINWIPHNLGRYAATSGLSGVACNGDQHCVAVGAITPIGRSPGAMRPVVYASFDSGNSWVLNYPEPLDASNGSALRAIACSGENGQFCIAVGDFSPLNTTIRTFVSYVSTDGGLNWDHYIIGDLRIDSSLTAISCNNGGEYCVAVGNSKRQPIIYETRNFGKNWKRVPFETVSDASLNGVTCSSKSCIAVGYENDQPIILKNNDNVNDWVKSRLWGDIRPGPHIPVRAFRIKGVDVDLTQVFLFTSSRLNSIACAKNGVSCTAIGFDSYQITLRNKHTVQIHLPVIYKSTDSGNNWYLQRHALSNESGYMPAIESVGMDITSIS